MDLSIILIIVSAIGLIFLAWIIYLELRWRKLFNDQKTPNLDQLLASLKDQQRELAKQASQAEERVKILENKSLQAISKTGLIKFNPFRGEGGNQSFVACFLNENNDGLLMSGIYSREKMNIYAKPIKNKTSVYELSTEEKEVINQAK